MNIGFDAKRAFHNASGLGNYSRYVIRILAEQFPEHDYFLFNPKKSDLWRPPMTASVHEILPGNTHKALSSHWRSFGGLKKIKKHQLDVYHGLSNELPFGIKKRTADVGAVVTIHDLIFFRYPELYKSVDRFIYRKKFKHAVKAADKIIAISKTTKEDIVDYLDIEEDKIEVVYQGCDPLFTFSSKKEDVEITRLKYDLPKEFIITVGSVEKRKNALNIVKAMHEFNIDFPLVIAGKFTPYKNEIDNYIAQNPDIKPRIHFVQGANNEEIKHLYELASFSIYPSIFEGFGIPVLESIACNTPVITSKEGCFKEAGGEAALYVDPNSTDELSEAINSLLSSSELRAGLVSECKKQMDYFDEKKLATEIMNIYKSCS